MARFTKGHASTRSLGLSLIEMLVVLALISLAFSLIQPSYHAFKSYTERMTLLHELRSTIQFARIEAIKRDLPVIICPKQTDLSCGTNWNLGWIVFLGPQQTASPKIDQILKIHGPIFHQDYLEWHSLQRNLYIDNQGAMLGSNGTFIYRSGFNQTESRLIISQTGRIREG